MCVLLITRLLRGVGRWARKPVNHTSWVAVVTPTDHPKSVRNCCLIELFCGVVRVVTLPFWHFCWCRGFCHRTGSDLLLFVLIPGDFYRTFATGEASQQRTLTLPDTWSFPIFDLHLLSCRDLSCLRTFWVRNFSRNFFFALKLVFTHLNITSTLFDFTFSISMHSLMWMNVMTDYISIPNQTLHFIWPSIDLLSTLDKKETIPHYQLWFRIGK